MLLKKYLLSMTINLGVCPKLTCDATSSCATSEVALRPNCKTCESDFATVAFVFLTLQFRFFQRLFGVVPFFCVRIVETVPAL